MKRNMLTLIAFVLSILIFTTLSWGQCPEDEDDRGECDTLVVTCLDCEIDTTVPGPYFVRFPILVTHDQIDHLDSIAGFVIPLTWTRTNPAAYCSVSAFWNSDWKLPLPPNFYEHSIFRHQEISPGDTMFNRMMTLAEEWTGMEWDFVLLDLDGISHFWFTAIPSGSADRRWWESDRELLATMTFKVEDTMHVCIDTVFWPPNSRLTFTRSDAATYVPRDNLPQCFWIGPPGEPDFAIAATPDTQYVQAGQATIYSVTLTSQFGFDSPCTLTVTGLPDFASADFDPNPLIPTGSSSMNVTTSATTSPGTYDLTITATELVKTQLVHETTVVLVVLPPPDFTIEVEPDSQEVQAGNSVGYEVILTSLNGFDTPCTLTVTGLPNDASADFTPNPATPTDTSLMFISTAETTSPGTYSLIITATELTKAQIVHDTTVVLTVIPPSDFSVEVDPDTQEVQAGGSVDYDVILTSFYGFNSPCTLTVTGLPDNTSAGFNPNPTTPTDTSLLTVSTAETTPTGTYDLAITATELTKAQIVHDTTVVLIVTPPPDFTVKVKPDTQEVQAGRSVEFDVILTSLYGFTSPCNLTATGLPNYTSVVFDPNPATPTDTSLLTVSTADSTPPGTYAVSVIAEEDKGIADTAELVLIVTLQVAPDTQQVLQGDSTTYQVILTSLLGIADWFDLYVDGLPTGASGSFDPNPAQPTDTSILTIRTDLATPPGTYTLTITASPVSPTLKAGVEYSTQVVLVVTPKFDFTIDVSPETQRIVWDSVGSYTIVLDSVSSASPCTLTVSGLPSGAIETFEPPTLVPTDTAKLNIFIPEGTECGFYLLTITATEIVGGKAIEHSKEVTLIVSVGFWDFYLQAYPDTQVVVVEDSTTYGVIMVPNTGFSLPCSLTIESGLPPDAIPRFDPDVIAPNDTSILTIIAAATTPPGFYELVIKGTANFKQESTTSVVLRVDEQSDVEDWAENSNTPKSFALFQNQPNPFNPDTKISYYLPKACQVRLTIYNVLGRRVKTLLDGYQETGTHTLLWDGRGDDGTQLSSGIYFYRLQADSFLETKKMTLMK